MPSNFNRATVAVNAEANAVCALLDGGWLCIFGGVQPPDANARIKASEPCLVEILLPAPAFQDAQHGRAVAHLIEAAISEVTAHRATWFRAYMSDRNTPVFDGSVGLVKLRKPNDVSADLMLDDVLIGGGVQVRIVKLIYQAAK